ncbi:MAG: His/Gly/Thr/Pro-type tRNA ligase C-terminal domain-containing protein, partial [Streptosporangiaceae bacterium]
FLIENYAGAFPVWLAPVQAVVLPIAEGQDGYARQVKEQLEAAGLRAEVAEAASKINYRVREAELRKVPYMLVVGKREAESGAVSVRTYQEKDRGVHPLAAVVEEIARKTRERTLDVAAKDYSALFRAEESAAPEAAY